jgi:hypothetical protein
MRNPARANRVKQSGCFWLFARECTGELGEYPRTGMNKAVLKFLPQASKKNNLYRKLFPDFFSISAATITTFPLVETAFQRNPGGLRGLSYIAFIRLLYSCIPDSFCACIRRFFISHIYLNFLSLPDLNLSQFRTEKFFEKFAAN